MRRPDPGGLAPGRCIEACRNGVQTENQSTAAARRGIVRGGDWVKGLWLPR
jgi:hypothetical protein